MNILVCYIGDDETIRFATEELTRYITEISREGCSVAIHAEKKHRRADVHELWLGLYRDFALPVPPAACDPLLDDSIHIDVAGLSGVIAGINPRSVLIGVYRFLTEAGCRWVRPGKDGTYLPKTDLSAISVHIDEEPQYRHRGVCIEGSVSYEQLADMIDWLPKIGMNAYFMQFRESFIFFDRWYTKEMKGSFSLADATKYTKMAAAEIKKRGLLYHAVGHGWTCEPLGLRGLGWDPAEYDLQPSVRSLLAEVGGKREVWEGVPLNTNLCYSNPEAQAIMVRNAVEYLLANKETDFLHFWLADGMNNQCECEACKRLRPSDFYVQILNRLDEAFTANGIHTKVVFLLYMDLLWPPIREHIKNTDRFILMFAPISRTYSSAFTPGADMASIPPYQRNNLVFPASVSENVAFLKQWQAIFHGDSFDFDYHLWWNMYNDPGHSQTPELLFSDIANLKKLGLNGFVSCQVQRAFLPTGLGMFAMAKSLWGCEQPYREIEEEYSKGAMGGDWKPGMEYLKGLTGLFDPSWLRGEKHGAGSDDAKRLGEVASHIRSFKPVIERNLQHENPCWRKSWEILASHSELCDMLALVFGAKANGDNERSHTLWAELKNNEVLLGKVRDVFDVFEFIQEIEKKLV